MSAIRCSHGIFYRFEIGVFRYFLYVYSNVTHHINQQMNQCLSLARKKINDWILGICETINNVSTEEMLPKTNAAKIHKSANCMLLAWALFVFNICNVEFHIAELEWKKSCYKSHVVISMTRNRIRNSVVQAREPKKSTWVVSAFRFTSDVCVCCTHKCTCSKYWNSGEDPPSLAM